MQPEFKRWKQANTNGKNMSKKQSTQELFDDGLISKARTIGARKMMVVLDDNAKEQNYPQLVHIGKTS